MNVTRLSPRSRWLKRSPMLGVTVDYLLGGTDKMVLDKKMVKRMEEIEALPDKKKEKIFDYIDLVIRDIKIKKAHAS